MTYIPDALRQRVHARAVGRCEYCLLSEAYTIKRHEIDHIIAEKHGGETSEANLCLCCYDCNRHKGSDLTSIDPQTGKTVSLFHPRRDRWEDHFRLEGALVKPLTPKGRVTVKLLCLNDPLRVWERELLIEQGRYP